MMRKMKGETLNITTQNIARLKELFPEIITDGDKIDFDMLKAALGEIVETDQERYQFTWHGKKKMIAGTQKPSKGTLRPAPEKSKNFYTTENLYIEGDNLEVLKLLQKSYNGKIKMIYIDPPYNTGGDFVYKDNFKNGVINYLELTGQIDSNGNRLSTNTDSNGRFHTDWLNMVYPRLKLSRNLLKEDGVIFISIDDNEYSNLKKLADEIFGENNFVATIVWQKKYSPQNDAIYFSNMHEYILVYAKNKRNSANDTVGWNRKLLPRTEQQNSRYKNPDNDSRGPWKAGDLTSKTKAANHSYPITSPTGKIHYPSKGRQWAPSIETMTRLLEENRIWFGADGNNVPSQKIFLSEVQNGTVPNTIWLRDEVGDSQEATQELKKIFDDGVITFETPKPIRLIKKIISLVIDEKENDIILDFFSGSATTAHATMQLNAEDGGNRKFIMVQLPEQLDEKSGVYKDGYRTICDIGEERIRRAGEKIKDELKEKQQKAGMLDENVIDPESLDIGFKVLKLETSNIREWNVDFENLKDELDLYETPFVDGRSELDIVYEIMLKHGLELTYPIEIFEVNGKTIYDIALGSLFICLSNEITTDIAKAIVNRRDDNGTETSSVIFSDTGFKNDSEKLNCIEILKDAGYPEDNLLTI